MKKPELMFRKREFDEERARYYQLRGDLSKAAGLLENLIESRHKDTNEIGLNTARLCLYQVRLAQNATENLAAEIEQIVLFSHNQNLYYYEALASLLLAETYFSDGKRKEMTAPMQRALDLSARFDYEHWLRTEILKKSAII